MILGLSEISISAADGRSHLLFYAKMMERFADRYRKTLGGWIEAASGLPPS
jgi:hypothetical protein